MNKKLVVVIVCFVIAIAFITIGAKVVSTQSQHNAARKMSDQFVSETLAGKYDKTYALLTTDAQKSLDTANWADKLATMHIYFAGRKPTFASVSWTGTPTFTYDVAGNDGSYKFVVILNPFKGSGGWRVQSFTSSLAALK